MWRGGSQPHVRPQALARHTSRTADGAASWAIRIKRKEDRDYRGIDPQVIAHGCAAQRV